MSLIRLLFGNLKVETKIFASSKIEFCVIDIGMNCLARDVHTSISYRGKNL